MKLKIHDKVKVLAGKDQGKIGKIIQVLSDENAYVVEGVNIFKRHLRSRKRGEKGQSIQFSAPIHASNVLLVCAKCGKTTRIGYAFVDREGGQKKAKKKMRMCRRCKEPIS